MLETMTNHEKIVKSKYHEIFMLLECDVKNEAWLEKAYILIHSLKGLCGLYGYFDQFDKLAKTENELKIIYHCESTISNKTTAFTEQITLLKASIDKHMFIKSKEKLILKTYSIYKLSFSFACLNYLEEIVRVCKQNFAILDVYYRKHSIIFIVVTSYLEHELAVLFKQYKLIELQRITDYRFKKKDSNLNCYIHDETNSSYPCILLQNEINNCCKNYSKIMNKQYILKKVGGFNQTIPMTLSQDIIEISMELIKNAFAHNERNFVKIISIIRSYRKHIILKIYNSGCRLKYRDLSKKSIENFPNKDIVFMKFVSKNTNKDITNNGLGLYDIKSKITKLNGKIYYKNYPHGVIFVVRLPLTNYSMNN